MENKIFKYVIKNKHTGVIYYKVYSFEQIEENGLKGLFDIENYDIIARLQYTGLNDKNGKRIFENDTHLDEENDLFKVVRMECGRYALKMISNNYVCEFIDWDKIQIEGNVHDKKEKL
jgi:hypothetical protein